MQCRGLSYRERLSSTSVLVHYTKFLKKTHYNSLKKELKKVISRINGVYGGWKRDTPIETMRADWDALYSDARISAISEDFEVDGITCRWVRAPEIDGPAIVLYVHGGGFRLGSIDSHLKLMSDIACEARCRVLGFNYSLLPEAHFPTQLNEALCVYQMAAGPGLQRPQCHCGRRFCWWRHCRRDVAENQERSSVIRCLYRAALSCFRRGSI